MPTLDVSSFDSLWAAIQRLPDPLDRSYTLRLPAGRIDRHGGPRRWLELDKRMRHRVRVTVIGHEDGTILDWPGDILATQGEWRWIGTPGSLFQYGSRTPGQQRAVAYTGATMAWQGATFRLLPSQSAVPALLADGGHMVLGGDTDVNADLIGLPQDQIPLRSSGGIGATRGGELRCVAPRGTLRIGNGAIVAGNWGQVHLNNTLAEIHAWNRRNPLDLNGYGHVWTHGTELELHAHDSRGCIGLENHCRIMHESDATIKCFPYKGVGHAVNLLKGSYINAGGRGPIQVMPGEGDARFRGPTIKSGSHFHGNWKGLCDHPSSGDGGQCILFNVETDEHGLGFEGPVYASRGGMTWVERVDGVTVRGPEYQRLGGF